MKAFMLSILLLIPTIAGADAVSDFIRGAHKRSQSSQKAAELSLNKLKSLVELESKQQFGLTGVKSEKVSPGPLQPVFLVRLDVLKNYRASQDPSALRSLTDLQRVFYPVV